MNEVPQVPAGVDTGRLELVQPYEGAEPGVTFTGLRSAEDVTMADSDGSGRL